MSLRPMNQSWRVLRDSSQRIDSRSGRAGLPAGTRLRDAFGPDIAPDGTHLERASYEQICLFDRLREVVRINPGAKHRCSDEAISDSGVRSPRTSVARTSVSTSCWRKAYPLRHRTDGLRPHRAGSGSIRLRTRRTTTGWWSTSSGSWKTASARRPDLMVFVNGLPLGLFELKNPADQHATLKDAWNQIQTYRATSPSHSPERGNRRLGRNQRRDGFVHGWLRALCAVEDMEAREVVTSMPALEVLTRGCSSQRGCSTSFGALSSSAARADDGEAGREVPPVLGGQRSGRVHGRGGRRGTAGVVSSGTPKAPARASRCLLHRQGHARPADGEPDRGRSSPTATTWMTSSSSEVFAPGEDHCRERPSRPIA